MAKSSLCSWFFMPDGASRPPRHTFCRSRETVIRRKSYDHTHHISRTLCIIALTESGAPGGHPCSADSPDTGIQMCVRCIWGDGLETCVCGVTASHTSISITFSTVFGCTRAYRHQDDLAWIIIGFFGTICWSYYEAVGAAQWPNGW